MARPPKGKPLTMRTVRLDDDVWAECQRLGKEHGTINEGLREYLIRGVLLPSNAQPGDVLIGTVEPLEKTTKLKRFKGPLLKPKERNK